MNLLCNVVLIDLDVVFFMQPIFRLLDFINVGMLGFATPDNFPTDKNEILKRMTVFNTLSYKVILYNTSLYMNIN